MAVGMFERRKTILLSASYDGCVCGRRTGAGVMGTEQPEIEAVAATDPTQWNAQTTVLAQLGRLDEAIKIEFDLVNARMTWLVVSESFIISSFVTAMAYYAPGHRIADGLLLVMSLTAILGLILAAVVIPAIHAAHSATDKLKETRCEWENRVEPAHMRVHLISSRDPQHPMGKIPAIWIPWVLVGVWCILIFFLLIRWPGPTFVTATAGPDGSALASAAPNQPSGSLNSNRLDGTAGASLQVTTNEMVIVGLVAVWLSATPMLTALQMLHTLREKVVLGIDRERNSVSRSLETEYCKAMLRSSYLPLFVGYLVFFGMITLSAFVVSLSATLAFYRLICVAVMIQFGLSFVGWLVGGLRDMKLMKDAISERGRRTTPSEPSLT
jgi:hypothetical protein